MNRYMTLYDTKGICILVISALVLFVFAVTAKSQEVTAMTLREVIRTALSDNLDLRRSSNQIADKELTLNQSRMDFYPSLSASMSSSKDYIKSSNGSFVDRTGASIRASLSSSINLFNGFRDINTYEKTRFEYQAVQKNYDYQRQSLILNAISKFIDVMLKEELIGIEVENLEAQKMQLDLVEAFYNAGNRSISDVLQQKADISQSELNLITAQRDYQVNYLELLKIMGKDPTDSVNFIKPKQETIISMILAADISTSIDSAFSQRSDLIAQEIQKQALEKSVKVAGAGIIPSASLSTSLGSSYLASSSAAGFNDQFIDTNPTLGIGLSISIPLFDKSQTKNNTERAKISLSDQKLNIENLKLGIRLEIEQALLDYKTAIKQREAVQAQFEFTKQALEASKARYKVGASTFTELSQIQAQYLSAANNRAQADWNLLLRYVTMCYHRGNIDEAAGLFD